MTIDIPHDDPRTGTEVRKDALLKALESLLGLYLGGEQINLELPSGPIRSVSIKFRGGATREALVAATTILRHHSALLPSKSDLSLETPEDFLVQIQKTLDNDRAARGIRSQVETPSSD